MPQSELVLEVQDRKDEAHKLAQSHDQCDSEGGALCCKDEHTPDAHVLSHDIHEEVEPHDGHSHSEDWNLIELRLIEQNDVVVNIRGQEDETGKWKGVLWEETDHTEETADPPQHS